MLKTSPLSLFGVSPHGDLSNWHLSTECVAREAESHGGLRSWRSLAVNVERNKSSPIVHQAGSRLPGEQARGLPQGGDCDVLGRRERQRVQHCSWLSLFLQMFIELCGVSGTSCVSLAHQRHLIDMVGGGRKAGMKEGRTDEERTRGAQETQTSSLSLMEGFTLATPIPPYLTLCP